MLRSFDGKVLCGIALISVMTIVLPRVLGPERQLITVNVSRAGVPAANLLMHVKYDDESSCVPTSGGFNGAGTTDSAGNANWGRPIPRRYGGGRRGQTDFKPVFDALQGKRPPGATVTICAVADEAERVIFSEWQELRDENPLDVTCDLATNPSVPCYGVHRLSFGRDLLSWAFLPLCVLLGVAMARAPERPMGRDAAGLGASVVLALLSLYLQKFWLLSQVLAFSSVAAVVVALAYTAATNLEYRASNRA